MLKDYKERLLHKVLNKELTLAAVNRCSTDKTVKLVGVLTTDAIAKEINFAQQIESKISQARNTRVYSFRKFEKFEGKSFKHFTEKDFNWKAQITDASLETFLETPFDLLIGFFDKKQVYLELAMLRSKATFKVGFTGVNDALFDLVIQGSCKGHKSFIDEVYKYLTILKKIG